jgi:hypothetical protein
MRIVAGLLLVLLFSSAAYIPRSRAQTRTLSPDAVVSDLYRQHNRKRSPFFQTRSRALVNKYFAKALADLIWKDAVNSKGEVGALSFDPLYDAQDTEIKNFTVAKALTEGGISQVPVSFENFGKKVQIGFLLIQTGAGWRISDIRYQEGHTLRSILMQP